MSDALHPTVPEGWYPDPWGSPSQRWWDGSSWTDTLDPQPEAELTDASNEQAEAVAFQPPGPPSQDSPPEDFGPENSEPEDDYVPVAVRSTFEPASSHRTAAASTPDSPFPSRRALRQLSIAPESPSVDSEPSVLADALPALTQPPEFSPEPVTVLPPPVWDNPKPIVPPHTATAEADDGWAAALSRWDYLDTSPTPLEAQPIFGDAPPVSYSQRATRYRPMHGRTSGVWLLVFLPLVQLACTLGSLYLFPGVMDVDWGAFAAAPTEAVVLGLLVPLRDWLLFAVLPLTFVFLVFALVLGTQDRARLRLLGHEQTASPWWIVLGPLVYLIVRSVRVRQCTGRRGSGPLTTFVSLYIAPPLALIVAQAVTSSLYGAIPA